MCIMADFVEKTLRELSIDKEGSKYGGMAYVTESMVKAIDFDAFAKKQCKSWHVQKMRSCDALLLGERFKYFIRIKNRPLHDQCRFERTPELDERQLSTTEGCQDFDTHFIMQHKLELELLEKLYESLIIIDGAKGKINTRIVEKRDEMIAIIVVSSKKNNNGIRCYNDCRHPNLYSRVFGEGDPLLDGLIMDNLNRPVAANDSEYKPKQNIDIYDNWFCPRRLKKLEGTLYRKVIFMTGAQLVSFLRSIGFKENV